MNIFFAVILLIICTTLPGERIGTLCTRKCTWSSSEPISTKCISYRFPDLRPNHCVRPWRPFGIAGVKKYVIQRVEEAGANSCPPGIVGVGIGGTLEKAALIAKKSLLRPIGQRNSNPEVAKLEEELLEEINKLGIGPQGLGGTVTALDVHIETYPTHIGSLPVAVNLQCHCARENVKKDQKDDSSKVKSAKEI